MLVDCVRENTKSAPNNRGSQGHKDAVFRVGRSYGSLHIRDQLACTILRQCYLSWYYAQVWGARSTASMGNRCGSEHIAPAGAVPFSVITSPLNPQAEAFSTKWSRASIRRICPRRIQAVSPTALARRVSTRREPRTHDRVKLALRAVAPRRGICDDTRTHASAVSRQWRLMEPLSLYRKWEPRRRRHGLQDQ